jgi:hypothetical protein
MSTLWHRCIRARVGAARRVEKVQHRKFETPARHRSGVPFVHLRLHLLAGKTSSPVIIPTNMEHMPAWLMSSFIYLSASVNAVPISKALCLGSIIGYLAAGIAIGP